MIQNKLSNITITKVRGILYLSEDACPRITPQAAVYPSAGESIKSNLQQQTWSMYSFPTSKKGCQRQWDFLSGTKLLSPQPKKWPGTLCLIKSDTQRVQKHLWGLCGSHARNYWIAQSLWIDSCPTFQSLQISKVTKFVSPKILYFPLNITLIVLKMLK